MIHEEDMATIKLKLAFRIWLAIYPSITLFLYVFGEALSAYSLPIKTLILTLVLVPWVVFAGVPAVDYLLSQFYKKR